MRPSRKYVKSTKGIHWELKLLRDLLDRDIENCFHAEMGAYFRRLPCLNEFWDQYAIEHEKYLQEINAFIRDGVARMNQAAKNQVARNQGREVQSGVPGVVRFPRNRAPDVRKVNQKIAQSCSGLNIERYEMEMRAEGRRKRVPTRDEIKYYLFIGFICAFNILAFYLIGNVAYEAWTEFPIIFWLFKLATVLCDFCFVCFLFKRWKAFVCSEPEPFAVLPPGYASLSFEEWIRRQLDQSALSNILTSQ